MNLYDNWWEEKRSAYLYAIMANYEKNILCKKLFLDLQNAAENQAKMWEKKMQGAGISISSPFKPDMRSYLVGWLIKYLGTKYLRYILSAMKIRGMSVFSHPHNEHRHTSFTSASNLRAAVFGINDGLVSNMSLILGFAGAHANQHFIILAGVAGLLAGACSMGAGEYISVRSQREVFERQIEIEKQELELYPEEEIRELSLIYQARGLPTTEANKFAKLLIDNPETGLNVLVREELGLNPEDLVSPLGAMLSSFFAFAVGAVVPVIPFFFGESSWHLATSITLTAITLFITGTVLSLFTNRNPILLGLRMLVIAFIAGGLTFFIGYLLGIE